MVEQELQPNHPELELQSNHPELERQPNHPELELQPNHSDLELQPNHPEREFQLNHSELELHSSNNNNNSNNNYDNRFLYSAFPHSSMRCVILNHTNEGQQARSSVDWTGFKFMVIILIECFFAFLN